MSWLTARGESGELQQHHEQNLNLGKTINLLFYDYDY